jgi:hypothetical protein
LLVKKYAAAAYDAFVFLPIEFALAGTDRPISEQFRVISDELLLEALHGLRVPVVVARGPLDRRAEQVTHAFSLPTLGVDRRLTTMEERS